MKTLLIGKTGQLGQALRRELALQTQLILLNQQEVSIVNITCLQQYIRQLQPDTIINAAAYTLVDKAEQQPLLAYKINTHVPKILAIEARKLDALLIHYSTDYIFNGQKNKPYVEEDTPRPLNIYGHSKWLGERAIQEECSKYFILRTSWLYSTTGENFFLTLQKLLQQNISIQVVQDQIGAPTWVDSLAQATRDLIHQEKYSDNSYGIYHATCAGETSWYEFARTIATLTQKQTDNLLSIPSKQYPSIAKRPANSCLNNQKLLKKTNIQLPHWKQSLSLCLEQQNIG